MYEYNAEFIVEYVRRHYFTLREYELVQIFIVYDESHAVLFSDARFTRDVIPDGCISIRKCAMFHQRWSIC